MIRIRIGGEWVDMPQEEVTMSWKNFRFADTFPDAFSTDMDFPLTKRNMRLLDVWGLQDRSGQVFGRGVMCQVVTDRRTFDGEIHVTEVGEDTVKATVMELSLPSSLKAQLNRLVVDDSDTIVDWHDQTLESYGNSNVVNVTTYDNGINPGSSADALYYPNIKVNSLIGKISAASGVSIATLGTDFRMLGTRRMVCPQNQRMAALFYSPLFTPSGGGGIFYSDYGKSDVHGEHIAIDYVTDTAPDTSTECTFLRANRQSKIRIDIALGGAAELVDHADMQIIHRSGGTDTVLVTLHFRAIPFFSYVTADLDEGDDIIVNFRMQRGDVVAAACLDCTISDYMIGFDDYDKEMPYVPDAVPAWTGWQGSVSYNYYGVMCNLPSMTVREFLSGLAWKIGKKIHLEGKTITFVDADDAADIGARILKTDFVSDMLGQRNDLSSADGVVLKSWRIDSDFLEETKEVYKSPFKFINDTQNTIGNMARVPQYEWSEDGSGNVSLKVTEVKEPVLVKCERYTLLAYKDVYTFDLERLTRVIEIEGVTADEISELDFVYINGHTYMLEEGDRDENSGLTTFKAFLL